MIPFLLWALGQHFAQHVELGVEKRLRCGARGDTLDAGDQSLRRGAQALDLDPLSSLILKRAVARDACCLLGIGADADLAFEPLRRADFADQHQRILIGQGYSAAGCSGSAGAGSAGSGGAAAASAAALAFSSAAARFASSRSTRFLPGWPFCGFERAARLRMPAATRNLSTRSVGCAPCNSQCWARSLSSRTRSPWSFGNSGSYVPIFSI